MIARFPRLILFMGLAGPLLAAEEPLPAPPPDLEPGLIVYAVEPDSPAVKAGVQVGDVLLTYDGAPLLFVSSLDEAKERAEAAKKEAVAVELRRDGETRTVTVPPGTLGVSARPPLPPAAQALWEEGRALTAENHTEIAEKWQAAAEAAQQAGDARAAAWLWGEAGGQWDAAQMFDRAAEGYARASDQSQAVGDALGTAAALSIQGMIPRNRGNPAEAKECHLRALAIRKERAPDSLAMARSLNNLGIMAYEQGDLAEAKEYHQRALAIQERLSPGSLDVATSLNRLGDTVGQQGDLAGAKAYYQRALTIQERLAPDSLHVAESLNNLGEVAWQQNDLAGAKAYLQRALAIREPLNSLATSESLNSLGVVTIQQGDLEGAKKYLQRALAIQEPLIPNSLALAITLNNLGFAAYQQGNLEEAKEYFQRALAIKRRLAPDSLTVARSLNNLGDVTYQQGNLDEAACLYCQGLRLARDRAGRKETVYNCWDLGRTRAAQGDLPSADEAYQLCLDALDEWRPHAGSEAEERAGLWAQYASPFAEYAALLLKREQPDAAFQVAERGKGRALLEVLSTGRTPLLERSLTPEERQEYTQREQAYARINRQVVQAQATNDQDRLQELLPKRDEARFQLANYEQRLYTLHPGLQAQMGEAKSLTADAARALPLPPDTLVLSYLVGEKQTLLFALRRPASPEVGELAVHTLDVPAKELEATVADLRETLVPDDLTPNALKAYQERSRRHYAERAQALGNMLLGPVQEWLKGAKHLIVCPDRFLYDVPFGMLFAPGQEEPLLTTHAVSLAPSVTVLGEWLKALPKPAEPPRLLALGNPALPLPPPKPEGVAEVQVAPLPPGRQLIDWGEGWRGEFQRTVEGGLVDLPFAAEEVQELAGLYGERATVQVGEAAQEAWVKAEAGRYRVLHFATHALLDNAAPMYSKLVLAQVGDLKGEDGLLEAREILQQRWEADLVVLSACQTARGRTAGGEGILGMSWACLAAGARQVVATQWSVKDDSTKALMVKFHQELLAGTPPTEALRRVQAHVRAQAQWAAPYHWAGFVLVGPGR